MSTSTAHGSSNGAAPADARRRGAALARPDRRPRDRRDRRGGPAARAHRRPRRARPRLHPRDAARALDARRASTSAPRCAGSRTSRRRARCCSWATTPAATSRPTRTSSRSRSAPTSASSAASTSSRTTSCCRCRGSPALRKYGTVAATPENAERALDVGAALLVYPGGDYEVHRPTLGVGARGLRRPQGLHPARQGARACRSCRWSRSAARRPRSSSRAASASRSCSGSTGCSA